MSFFDSLDFLEPPLDGLFPTMEDGLVPPPIEMPAAEGVPSALGASPPLASPTVPLFSLRSPLVELCFPGCGLEGFIASDSPPSTSSSLTALDDVTHGARNSEASSSRHIEDEVDEDKHAHAPRHHRAEGVTDSHRLRDEDESDDDGHDHGAESDDVDDESDEDDANCRHSEGSSNCCQSKAADMCRGVNGRADKGVMASSPLTPSANPYTPPTGNTGARKGRPKIYGFDADVPGEYRCPVQDCVRHRRPFAACCNCARHFRMHLRTKVIHVCPTCKLVYLKLEAFVSHLRGCSPSKVSKAGKYSRLPTKSASDQELNEFILETAGYEASD